MTAPDRSMREMIEEYRTVLVARTPQCGAVRQSDEAMCPRCGLRWSLDEDRPECPR